MSIPTSKSNLTDHEDVDIIIFRKVGNNLPIDTSLASHRT